MPNKVNMEQVLEALQEMRSTSTIRDPERKVEVWVKAKGIDEDTLDKIVSFLVELATKEVMGVMVTTGGNPAAVAVELRQLLGTGIEIGYTACEAQLEGRFIE